MKEYTAKLFDRTKYLLAESPFFDPKTGIISFVDILKGMFYRIDKETMASFDCREQIGSAVPMEDGSYMICGTKGIYRFADDGMSQVFDLTPYFEPWQRCNDCKADPRGRLFIGSSSMSDEHEGGNLYLFDGDLRVLIPDTGISNGMAWNGDKFYFADSLDYAVYVFNYSDCGNIEDRKVLFTTEGGVPDGLCIDKRGDLWAAVWGGARIEHRDGKTGGLLSVVNVPAVNVTSCCFISEDTLFITTSGEGLEGETDGCLFTCRVEIA